MLIFQTWLVALKTGEFDTESHTNPALANIRRDFIPELVRKLATSTATLACIPPFSLNFWADVDLAGFRPRFSHENSERDVGTVWRRRVFSEEAAQSFI